MLLIVMVPWYELWAQGGMVARRLWERPACSVGEWVYLGVCTALAVALTILALARAMYEMLIVSLVLPQLWGGGLVVIGWRSLCAR